LQLLFVGNSYTNRNNLPGLLAELLAGRASPIPLYYETVLANGASLRQHWNHGRAVERLRAESWTALVLQEQSTLPIKNAGRYHENVRLFAAEARACNCPVLLYETWARRDAPDTQSVLSETVEQIAVEVGAEIVRVGTAWRAVRGSDGAPELFDRDGSHPSPAGTLLAALVFAATLLGEPSPPPTVPARLGLTASAARVLTNAAWEAAQR
jgi:hypothetical protein